MSGISKQGPKCPMCGIVAIKLVPMQDTDQHHTGQMACRHCKKAIKNDLPIKKVRRNE